MDVRLILDEHELRLLGLDRAEFGLGAAASLLFEVTLAADRLQARMDATDGHDTSEKHVRNQTMHDLERLQRLNTGLAFMAGLNDLRVAWQEQSPHPDHPET